MVLGRQGKRLLKTYKESHTTQFSHLRSDRFSTGPITGQCRLMAHLETSLRQTTYLQG
jgi:hypothetical protein